VGGGGILLLVCAARHRHRETVTALKAKILRLIREQGPISVADYMQMALLDPEHGYYIKRDPLGRDFITAPEISQIFGELIGLLVVQAWEDRGSPRRFHLVELGPGRGTLMADMLRAAAKVRPDFVAATGVVLVEASPVLRVIQAKTLEDRNVQWVGTFAEVPNDAPLFLVANEFFDALALRQFVKTFDSRRREVNWHERMISAQGEKLAFALAPEPVPAALSLNAMPAAQRGAIFETQPAAQAIVSDIAHRIASKGGLGLIVDYGHVAGLGDTFQAIKAHAFADPLEEPGEADLTAHVDFGALADAAREEHAQVWGPVTQAEFLEALGIRLRGERLKRAAPETANEIDAAIDRLTGKEQMGTLFKVLALAAPNTSPVPGFSC
jgi:NADH dehydrogenase [ubiquinone] 1 alpha subcomplex assembly factor 7